MPIVINEFEMLPEKASAPAAPQESQGDGPQAAGRIEPLQIAPALHRISERAARIWAH